MAKTLLFHNPIPAVTRRIDVVGSNGTESAWWDLMAIQPDTKTLQQFLSPSKGSSKYAKFERRRFYEMARCQSQCQIDPNEIMKLAMIDFICQNHDRLNREYDGMRGDYLVHIFVNPRTSKLVYIDNTCEVKMDRGSVDAKYDVDWNLETRAILEITRLFNGTTLKELYKAHIGSAGQFAERLMREIASIHMGPKDVAPKRLKMFRSNVMRRVQLLSGLMLDAPRFPP